MAQIIENIGSIGRVLSQWIEGSFGLVGDTPLLQVGLEISGRRWAREDFREPFAFQPLKKLVNRFKTPVLSDKSAFHKGHFPN